MSSGDDKTEAATPRKRTELRRRGQVAKSQDLSSMVVLLGVIVCIHAVGGGAAMRLRDYMRTSFATMAPDALTTHLLFAKAGQFAMLLLATVGPVILTAITLGSIVNILQTGLMFSPQALKPDFNRMNPLAGVKRLISGRGLVETVKALAKLGIIAWIAWSTISGGYPRILETIRQDIPTLACLIGDLLYHLAIRMVGFLLVLSAIDYGYQRWAFEKSIRMTKQEVKQEMKQQEASPQMRARIRARQRQMARSRMMSSVPLADVIITNPTHFAVALKYDPTSMSAPLVVAKGADILAAKIREIAEEHDIPLVENPPLARNLYRNVDIGREIPAELYGAVAEILAYIYQINAAKRRQYARA